MTKLRTNCTQNYAFWFVVRTPYEAIEGTYTGNLTFNFNTNTLQNKLSNGQALVPTLIRVMEASNTGDMINLPVIKAAELKNKTLSIPKEALDIFVTQIQNEYAILDSLLGLSAVKYQPCTHDSRRFLIG